jgi:shikimate 5-dehydrogenase
MVQLDQDTRNRLALINRQAKRVERAARILKQQSAQLIEGKADQSTAEEANENGSNRSDTD